MSIRFGRRRRGTSGPGVLLLVGLIFAVVGLVFAGMGVYFAQEALASEDWPTTTARITAHDIEIDTDDDGTSYTPRIRYSYTVAEQRYTGTRFGVVNESFGRMSGAQAKLDEYPIESQHTVYYNPDNPSASVLEPGMTFGTWFFPIFGGLFALIGFALFGVGVLSMIRGGP